MFDIQITTNYLEVFLFDFFISYKLSDRNDLVESIIRGLINRGFDIWEDKTEIVAGDSINALLQDGLSQSYCMIMLVTPNYFTSNWTTWEFATFNLDQKKRIIPIIINPNDEARKLVLRFIGNVRHIEISSDCDIKEMCEDLKKALEKTKSNNRLATVLDRLTELKKQLNARENIKTISIGLLLDEYLKFANEHPDYIYLSAKKIVETVVRDIYEIKNESKEAVTDLVLPEAFIRNSTCFNENIKETILYFYRESPSNVQGHLMIISEAVANILTWYIKIKYPLNIKNQNFEVVWPTHMKYVDFLDMYEIDKIVLRDDLIADAETTFAWYQYNNYTHIALRDCDTRKIIGYYTLLPITDETYDAIISGDFMDKDFNADSLLQYDYPGFYRLYIAAVAIHPNYQNSNAFLHLYNALIDLILYISEKMEAVIYEIVAEASTKQGEKLCKMVGMKKSNRTLFDTDIYTLNLIPPEFRTRNKQSKELMKLCRAKYQEYRDEFEC